MPATSPADPHPNNTISSGIKNIILSPGVSVILGLLGIAAMLPSAWLAALLSVPVCGVMVSNIKARTLFRGPNFPFAAVFLALQAATAASWSGTAMTLYIALALTPLFLCFQRPNETRTFFLIFLGCGLGALWMRAFLLAGAALLIAILLLRALSPRGVVAALLGLLTPPIILGGFGLLDVFTLIKDYSMPLILSISPEWILSAAVSGLFCMLTFLTAYGYPAKARARNMAILGLSACALILPCLDSLNAPDYIPLLNLCAAYNVGHFAASQRFGWIGYLAVLIACLLCRLYCI